MLRRSHAAESSDRAESGRGTSRVDDATAPGNGAPRFQALWNRCVASPPSPGGAVVYADLRRLFGAAFRRYHTLDHIHDCVRRVDEVRELLADPDAVELALWFHDAVYDMDALTNERRSAELFAALSEGADPAFRRRVCGLIMATRHIGRERGNDRRFIVDIDLAGFGAPWDEFMRNGALLREESPAKTDAQYHAGQIYFLRRLQRRRQFFSTDYFRDRYEKTARANLSRLLDDLTHRGYAGPTL
jgi:predicted metal-dependent HD superfamily phosphohydrolase